MTRTCDQCGKHLVSHRKDARFCTDDCKNAWHNEERRRTAGTDKRLSEESSGVGSRGGNVRDLDEARGLQEEQKEKARWTLIVREHIARTLLETGYFHTDDLDVLGVPPAHCNVKGSQIGSFRSRKLMEKTGQERKVSHAAADGRKAPIYRVTPEGRKKLSKLVGVGGGVVDQERSSDASPHPGEKEGVGDGAGQQRGPGAGHPGNPTTSVVPGEPSLSPAGSEETPAGESPVPEAVPLFEEEHKAPSAFDPWSEAA